MSPVRDTNLMLRQTSDGDLTATATLTAKQIEGTFAKGMALQINAPTAWTGTSPTLTITMHGDTDNSSGATSDDAKIATFEVITAYGEYILPFSTPKRSIVVELTVAGTSPNLGALEIGIVENVGKAWSRGIEFH